MTTIQSTMMGALSVNEIEAGIVDHTLKVARRHVCSHVAMVHCNLTSTVRTPTQTMMTVAVQCVQSRLDGLVSLFVSQSVEMAS